jgi:hypothetical protein
MQKSLLLAGKAAVCVVLLFIFSFFPGCTASKYEKVTVSQGSMPFTFEYPKSLKTGDDFNDWILVHYIYLSSTKHDGDGKEHTEKLLRIAIDDFTSNIPDASASIASTVRILTASNYPIKNVEILERTGMTVAGITGEMIHYNAVFPATPSYDNHLMSCRELAFVYKQYVWKISYDTYAELENEAAAEFDNIVNSFKFIKS